MIGPEAIAIAALFVALIIAVVYYVNIGTTTDAIEPVGTTPPFPIPPRPESQPAIGTYRIIPWSESKFRVQQYKQCDDYVWDGCNYKRSKTNKWETHSEFHASRISIPVDFRSEEEAEKYIADKLDEGRKHQEYLERIAAHAEAYPPREVPPFKVLKV